MRVLVQQRLLAGAAPHLLQISGQVSHDSSCSYLSEQFDQLQDELERRREECIQLRTVLANVSLSQDQHVSGFFTQINKTGISFCITEL